MLCQRTLANISLGTSYLLKVKLARQLASVTASIACLRKNKTLGRTTTQLDNELVCILQVGGQSSRISHLHGNGSHRAVL